MIYLLDSVVILWRLRNLHNAEDIVGQLSRDGMLAASALTLLEVERSVEPSEVKAAEEIFEKIQIVPVDSEIARRATAILRQAWAEGYRMDFISAVVSATAATKGMVLVTYNIMHYPATDVSIFPLETLVA